MAWWNHSVTLCVIACVVPNIGGFIGSLFVDTGADSWYALLEKPSFNPPSWLFFPAWTILYIAMGFASFIVWKKGDGFQGRAKVPLIIFIIQLILNWFWPPIFGFLVLFVIIAITTALFYRIDFTSGCCMHRMSLICGDFEL